MEKHEHATNQLEQVDTNHLEHVETKQSGFHSEHDLKQQQTLQHVDLENRHAFKGDDSDGKIDWTLRKILASCFLAMLYTGILSSALLLFEEMMQIGHIH
jgi:hypothetical protein